MSLTLFSLCVASEPRLFGTTGPGFRAVFQLLKGSHRAAKAPRISGGKEHSMRTSIQKNHAKADRTFSAQPINFPVPLAWRQNSQSPTCQRIASQAARHDARQKLILLKKSREFSPSRRKPPPRSSVVGCGHQHLRYNDHRQVNAAEPAQPRLAHRILPAGTARMPESPRPFVHLHCHSHYSLLDGASEIGALVKRAKEHGMNSLALTDHGNLHGALEFYKTAKEAGINPIIGYEAYIAPGGRYEKKDAANSKEASYHLTLLAQNRTGFKNLVKLASAASLEGFYYKPRIDKELLAAHHEGIVCLSGCVSSELSLALIKGGADVEDFREAREIAAWFQGVFGERYFIEIMNNGVEVQRLQLEAAVDLAKRLGIPLVATSDAHYVRQDDAVAQDVLLCINTGKFRTDTNRMRMENDTFYLRSPEEMYAHFPGLEDAVG